MSEIVKAVVEHIIQFVKAFRELADPGFGAPNSTKLWCNEGFPVRGGQWADSGSAQAWGAMVCVVLFPTCTYA